MRQSERIQAASLRLYTLIQRDQNNYVGVERLVRIKMATSSVFDNNVAGEEEGSPNVQLRTVCERNIYERENAWETFDVTSALKHWLDRPELVQVLQVYIESVFSTAGSGGRLDVATEPYTDSEPLLLVYSRGHHRKRHRAELHAMIDHEYDTAVRESDERRDRRKRSYTEEQEEMSNTIWSSELPPPKGHLKLRKKSKRSCKRKPMHVDFAAIGWDHWIIAPKGYQAYQCTGKCFYPLPSHLSPTKHAVVQNLVHSLHPETASRACCVPTELGPISLLYMEANVPTYKYNYDDMVVLKCGCR
ncbi:bone morphogenetic protein 10-like [Oratosquilla oratoria]|uniref:bone morphogenetic protein 10-like n=1 Tax=Oratosquilla oratoria TaxID=337810 RepID=UPI003F76C34F